MIAGLAVQGEEVFDARQHQRRVVRADGLAQAAVQALKALAEPHFVFLEARGIAVEDRVGVRPAARVGLQLNLGQIGGNVRQRGQRFRRQREFFLGKPRAP